MQKLQYLPQNMKWCCPLDLAATIDEEYFVLLYSGVRTSYSGRYSFLACGLREKISTSFSELEQIISADQAFFDNIWFGYLGYELYGTLESKLKNLIKSEKNSSSFPPLCLMRFDNIYQFDHDTQTLTLWNLPPYSHSSCGYSRPYWSVVREVVDCPPPPSLPNMGGGLHSNMTRAEYLQKATHIIEKIHNGDLYQANLTRKFYGEFSSPPNCFSLFERLCAISPAPYSAFIRMADNYILSSSPELFLSVDSDGNVISRPIKGTSPRGSDKESDENLKKFLYESKKDRAENLMIVDLVRNDLAKSCAIGSIKLDSLFDITTHATIHHLSSTVSGRKKNSSSTLDVVRAAFPAGSMTGAPKISAIKLCNELEVQERGVYSGAIGWFGGDGSCELSVVIRTLLISGNKFEFQVGGGIVADSTPENELDELINKAKGILLALGLSTDAIRNI